MEHGMDDLVANITEAELQVVGSAYNLMVLAKSPFLGFLIGVMQETLKVVAE